MRLKNTLRIRCLALRIICLFVIASVLCEGVIGAYDVALLDGQPTIEYPAVGKLTLGSVGRCTGTLISSNLVLTAAHCIIDPAKYVAPDKCGRGFPEGGFSGDLKETIKFSIDSSEGTYEFVGVYGWSLGEADKENLQDDAFPVGGSEWTVDDVGLVLLATPVPARIATPMPIAKRSPVKDTKAAIVGYGCKGRQWSEECGRHLPIKSDVEKQVVLRKVGGPTYYLCPGDSGGPWFTLPRGEIYAVSSAVILPQQSDEERRKSGTSQIAEVAPFKRAIDTIRDKFKDFCSIPIFREGKMEYDRGRCR